MEKALFISIWGALLSTGLGIFTIYERWFSRPIIKSSASFQFRRVDGNPKYLVIKMQYTPHSEDVEDREVFIEFKAKNYGNKSIIIKAVYIDTEDCLIYAMPEKNPIVLDGKSSIVLEIQKEFFDSIDAKTRARVDPKVIGAGFVDMLDKKYPIKQNNLQEIVKLSSELPTSLKVYCRKSDPTGIVVAYQTVTPAIIMQHSEGKKWS